MGRWLEGGLDTAVKDIAFVTNWDGRFNPGSQQHSTSQTAPASEEDEGGSDMNQNNSADSNDNTRDPASYHQDVLNKFIEQFSGPG